MDKLPGCRLEVNETEDGVTIIFPMWLLEALVASSDDEYNRPAEVVNELGATLQVFCELVDTIAEYVPHRLSVELETLRRYMHGKQIVFVPGGLLENPNESGPI